jgi:hypothetical protein
MLLGCLLTIVAHERANERTMLMSTQQNDQGIIHLVRRTKLRRCNDGSFLKTGDTSDYTYVPEKYQEKAIEKFVDWLRKSGATDIRTPRHTVNIVTAERHGDYWEFHLVVLASITTSWGGGVMVHTIEIKDLRPKAVKLDPMRCLVALAFQQYMAEVGLLEKHVFSGSGAVLTHYHEKSGSDPQKITSYTHSPGIIVLIGAFDDEHDLDLIESILIDDKHQIIALSMGDLQLQRLGGIDHIRYLVNQGVGLNLANYTD